MATHLKTEVVWLPSHEEIVVKQEKNDCLETWANISGPSNQELIECKIEKTPDMYIKEESQEPMEDEELSSLDFEPVNYPKFQAEDTAPKKENCREVNCVDSDKRTGFIVEESDCKTKYFETDNYKVGMEYDDKSHDSIDENYKEDPGKPVALRKIQIGEKHFVCVVCYKAFSTKRNLTRHVRTHSDEKPFSCDLCFKQFREERFLVKHAFTIHRRTRAGIKLYSCDLCEKQYSEKNQLIKHKRRHTGEKPFSCDLCHKLFIDRKTLAGHRRTHTGEKPFSCDLCHKQFTEKGNLNRHRRIHTGEKRFSCDLCHKQFTARSGFTNHRKTHR